MIRPIAIALIQHQGRVLAAEGYDPIKKETFYRPLGGGIEFGETAAEAVKRELQEELKADLIHISKLAVVENIFTYNGQPGHEIVFLMAGTLTDPTLLESDEMIGDEGGSPFVAKWIDAQAFLDGRERIYPEAIKAFFAQ